MKQTLSFKPQVAADEKWFEQHAFVFQSEVEALRRMLPGGENFRSGIIGLGTEKFYLALGLKDRLIFPASRRTVAVNKKIKGINTAVVSLPYEASALDIVLMPFCINNLNNLSDVFKEAYRVLKLHGTLIVGFIDQHSVFGKYYQAFRPESTFFKQINLYPVEKVVFELLRAGFKKLNYCQTLFRPLDQITAVEPVKSLFGEGSYVVIQAKKEVRN